MDNSLDTEKALIALAQTGDISAFERLLQPLAKRMLAVAAGLLLNKDEADDIYQESMLQAYKAMPKFNNQSQFSTWLYRITVNTAISHNRKPSSVLAKLIHKNADDEYDIDELEQIHTHGNPEQRLNQLQLSSAIQNGLKTLSKQERIAFVLSHQQELKISEAAAVMNCSEGSVKSYLFRARDKMRTQLESFKD